MNVRQLLHRKSRRHKVSWIGSKRLKRFPVVTDRPEAQRIDQVFPLHMENQFFLDEMDCDRMKDASVLEIGTGSGVLSIAAAKAGATRVLSLEVNPRAIAFAGFNLFINDVEGIVEVRLGKDCRLPVRRDRESALDCSDIFEPVGTEQFDLIITNPPFEPTPPGLEQYLHSGAGPYGLDYVKKILKRFHRRLNDGGGLQMVSFSPGDRHGPFMLTDCLNQIMGQIELVVNPAGMLFNDFIRRFAGAFGAPEQSLGRMKTKAAEDKVTHLYLCMVHVRDRWPSSLSIRESETVYRDWDIPLGSKAPMGVKR
jgi:SAM-dependent methyltransferase